MQINANEIKNQARELKTNTYTEAGDTEKSTRIAADERRKTLMEGKIGR
jgi:hypothetical protein